MLKPTPSLAREIALALALKTALLGALWYAFFSHPLDKKLTPAAVENAVLARTAYSDRETATDTNKNEVNR